MPSSPLVTPEILVIWPDDAAAVRTYCRKEHLPFPNLIDPNHEIANRYGQEVKLLKLGRLPELVIVDTTGVVRYAHHASSMSDIVPSKTLWAVLERIA